MKVILNAFVLTAIPTPSQSSDEDIRLSVDIPSALDKPSVCISLVMSMLIVTTAILRLRLVVEQFNSFYC